MLKEVSLIRQVTNFQTYLDRLDKQFLQLSIKRIQKENEMTRDDYIMYDTFDMLIHFVAAVDEVVGSKEPYPGYIVEKMKTVQSYVNTCVRYFEGRMKDKEENE